MVDEPQELLIWGVSPFGQPFGLYAPNVVLRLWMVLIFIGPFFILIHWLRNRRAMRRSLGERVQIGPAWPIWLALFVLLFLTLFQLWLQLQS